MPVAFSILLITIALAPLDFFWPWPGLLGLRLLLAGAGLFFATGALASRDRMFLQKVTRYALFCFAFVALSIVLQLVPFKPFAHPFWASAAAALQRPIAGTISIDIGATLLAFARISLVAALTLLAAAVAIDRARAEWILITLTVVAGLVLESFLFGVIAPAAFGMIAGQDIDDDMFTSPRLRLFLR